MNYILFGLLMIFHLSPFHSRANIEDIRNHSDEILEEVYAGKGVRNVLSAIHFIKCVPENQNAPKKRNSVYLLDGFRFETEAPLVLEAIFGSRKSLDFQVEKMYSELRPNRDYFYRVQARSSRGDILKLKIDSKGKSEASLNNRKFTPNLLCRVGKA